MEIEYIFGYGSIATYAQCIHSFSFSGGLALAATASSRVFLLYSLPLFPNMQRKFKVIKSFGVRWVFVLACQCLPCCFFSATRKRKRDSKPIEKDSECMPFCVCVSSTSLLLFWIRKPNQISYDRIFMESINLLLALCLQKWTLKQTPTNAKFHTIPRPFAV